MKYLIKFNKDGRRGATHIFDEKTKEEVQAMLDDGFEIIEDEVYQLLLGNVDGKEYVRNTDGTFSEYVPPAPSLEELKTAKLAELKSTRDTLEVEPISYQGYSFDYDSKARDRISAAIIALDVSKGQIAWTTADNTEVMVTADDLHGVIAAVALRSNELHVKYRQLKEQVEACTTKEQLEKIEW